MAITLETLSGQDGCYLAKITGDLNYTHWPDFKEKCLSLAPTSNIVFDLRNTQKIDTAGLGMILLLSRRVGTDKIMLMACNENLREFLDCVDVERWCTLPKGCRRASVNAVCSGACHAQ